MTRARSVRAFGSFALFLFLAPSPPSASAAVPLDRVVAVLEAAELGGIERPFFLMAVEWSLTLEVLRGRSKEGDSRRRLDAELGLRLLKARADRMELEYARSDGDEARHMREARAALEVRVRSGLVARAGGAADVERLRVAHPTFERSFQAMVSRRASAAIAAETLGIITLKVDESTAREFFRAGGHPFEAARFDDAREAFADWLLVDQLERCGQRHMDQLRRLVRVTYGSVGLTPTSF